MRTVSHKMRPGDIEIPNNGKTVYVTMGLFLDDDGQIHITFGDGQTTVSNNQKYKRYHQNLYKHLREILNTANRWNPVPGAKHLESSETD